MRVLLIEDDTSLNQALSECLEDEGFDVDAVNSAQEGLIKAATDLYQIIISDIKMAGMTGYEFLQNHVQKGHQTPVILMTAYGTIEQAVNALKLGASDYITKPFDMKDLVQKIHLHALPHSDKSDVIICSEKSIALYEMAQKVAKTDATVLIQGESGTGKEVLARYVHNQSKRSSQTFIGINCAAIPENMLEATLFGYEKGAFTGAVQSTPGKFERAHGGTLLLDEISEMPLNLQVKLLRVLQENEVERLGGKKQIPLDVRLIAATNRDLSKEVQLGKFREDLYFRLNVFPIECIALRQRKEDILPLAESTMQQWDHLKQLSEQAKAKLIAYNWPGNVRELQNIMQRAMILAPGNLIEAEHLMMDEPQTAQSDDLNENLKSQEFNMILEVLENCQGDKAKAAETLGISPRTLRYKIANMKKLGLIS